MILIISLIMHITQANINELIQVRQNYSLAAEKEQAAKDLLSWLQPRIKDAPEYAGYAGAVQMIMAKYYFNPYSKYDAFQKGKTQLEAAISAHPDNVELRYLRFATQCNTPSFLGYNADIERDKQILLTKVKTLSDKDLRNRIVSYLLSSGKLTDAEKAQLNSRS